MMNNKHYKIVDAAEDKDAAEDAVFVWQCHCYIQKMPYIVVLEGSNNKRRWSTVEFNLDPVCSDLTQKGLNEYGSLTDEYIKDKKMKKGFGYIPVNYDYAKVRTEHAEDFAVSLVGIFNEPGNIAPREKDPRYEQQMLSIGLLAKNGMLNELFESEITIDLT